MGTSEESAWIKACTTRKSSIPLSDDVSSATRFICVARKRFAGFEVLVAFDWEPERTANGAQFGHAYVAEFRAAPDLGRTGQRRCHLD